MLMRIARLRSIDTVLGSDCTVVGNFRVVFDDFGFFFLLKLRSPDDDTVTGSVRNVLAAQS